MAVAVASMGLPVTNTAVLVGAVRVLTRKGGVPPVTCSEKLSICWAGSVPTNALSSIHNRYKFPPLVQVSARFVLTVELPVVAVVLKLGRLFQVLAAPVKL